VTTERRYRGTIEYDGTDFWGYQLQATGRTVQGELEKSLAQITGTFVRIDGAGRTDAGVHAVGQVIAFNTAWKHSLADLHRALNATLPRDIIVSDLKIAADDFHPRFSALSRSYRYTIINQTWPSVLQRRYACHVREKLKVEAMRAASRFLLGTHDFASFGHSPQGEITIREVTQAEWTTDGVCLMFDVTANAFLYRMVRTIVGTLLQVGMGRLTPNEIEPILAAHDLRRSAAPAPAHGLCLRRVTYPGET
jgi:tRNA pseudouridine38-40 synthase